MMRRIDLNSDMGERETPEELAQDAQLMPLITSVNIACGGHAGSPMLMRRTAQLAAENNVAIGAHPGFCDPANFGRREQLMPLNSLMAVVAQQIETLAEILAREGLRLIHVKPHGAMYNMASRDADIAQALVRAVKSVDSGLIMFARAGSELVQAAVDAGLGVAREAFTDRAYRANGDLVPRSDPGAVLTTEEMVRRQLHLLMQGSVISITGLPVPILADTICIHSDTPRAGDLTRMIRHELESAGVRIAAIKHESV